MIPAGPILIVEDDGVTFRAWKAFFRSPTTLQYPRSVDQVATVADAIAAIDRIEPECVLLDLHLPDGCGSRVIQHIRSRRLPIRIFILSGSVPLYADDPLIDQADRVFPKPCDVADLLKAIDIPPKEA